MDIIRDIAKLSEYQPASGDLLELYKIAMEPMLSREQAMIEFEKSPSHFRNTYKELKDRLLDGVLHNSFSSYPKHQQVQARIWKKYVEVMILLSIGESNTAAKIGEETVSIAEKYGLITIVLDISRRLEIRYANLGNAKYIKFQQKVIEYSRLLLEEQKVNSLHSALVYRFRKKQNWEELIVEIEALDNLLANNQQYKFRFIYYSLRNILFQLQGNLSKLVQNSEAAILFFDAYPTSLAPTIKWSFLIHVLPFYISQRNFKKAAHNLQRSAEIVIKGSYNWQLSKQYLVILGFHSLQLERIQKIILEVKKTPSKFTSALLDARWKIIIAYVALFQKAGTVIVRGVNSFRLYRFLNEMNAIKKDTLKVNVFILELLHLLAKGDQTQYLTRTQSIEPYISKNVKGKENARTRYFLRMLKSVIKGGHHPVRAAAHAKKNKDRLSNTATSTNMDLLDTEVVPYEALWDLVMVFLAKNKKISLK